MNANPPARRQSGARGNFISSIASISPLDRLLPRLDGVRQTGPDKYLARCPLHDDRSPSFSIRVMEDGRLVLHDFGGCPTEGILASIGLGFADLFPARAPDPFHQGETPKPPRFQARDLIELAAFESLVVSIVANDILKGKQLSPEDHARLQIAETVLAGIAREVLHGHR